MKAFLNGMSGGNSALPPFAEHPASKAGPRIGPPWCRLFLRVFLPGLFVLFWPCTMTDLLSFRSFWRNAFRRQTMAMVRYTSHSVRSGSNEASTSHFRQTFIFSLQLLRACPSQTVPLMNQQRLPALNSQAGHICLLSGGHPFAFQQGTRGRLAPLCLDARKKTCRSTWAGTFRHPCS